ncbi:MAG: hypothetical protein JW892_14250 [Anaerolineae bacterium]|nr:hypothetical protein [Anaerolineae bacterium]
MKIERLFIVVALTSGLLLGLLILTVPAALPTQALAICDRYVANGGNNSFPDNDCSDFHSPCKTIQYALQWAADGETICVADRSDIAGPATYYGTVVITKSVVLDGAWDAAYSGSGWNFNPVACAPEDVVIEGDGLARVISITHANPTIYCFTITGGNAGGAVDEPNHGGGIAAVSAAPVILNNIISNNYGCTTMACTGYGRGGGIYLVDAPATAVISGNQIINNVADDATWGQGGGIYLEDASPQILTNTIRSNRAGHSAGDGGGIAVFEGSPIIAGNHIQQNTAGQAVLANGGGIFIHSSTLVTIAYNLLEANVALRGAADPGFYSTGGGIHFHGPLAFIHDNEVYGNAANLLSERGLGGGMYLSSLSDAAVVRSNVIARDNRASYVADGNGGGLYLAESEATVADNSIFDNTAASDTPGYGGGIYVNGGAGLLLNNTIAHNTAVLGAVGGWGWGGGISARDSDVRIQGNVIAENVAISSPAGRGSGGGIYAFNGAPRFTANQVLRNTTGGGDSGYGGGLSLCGRVWVEGNTILDNRAPGLTVAEGGGVRIASSYVLTFVNNIVARNVVSMTGSGVMLSHCGPGKVAHNTVAANSGGDGAGIYVKGNYDVPILNHIIVSQTVGIFNATPAALNVLADYTLFEGNGSNASAGVISTHAVPGPAALLADYHLSSASNAMGQALPLAWLSRDIDGDPRSVGLPDVGADEFVKSLYLPLVLRQCP